MNLVSPSISFFRSLGLNLALADPPESDRLQILNEAWKVITKLKNPQDYINCAEVWVEYTCKHFTKREVNTVLADVIKHMTPDRAFEDSYPQLQLIIKKVIAHFHDFSVLFSVEKFLPFLDMFQKESVRVEVLQMHHGRLYQASTRAHQGPGHFECPFARLQDHA